MTALASALASALAPGSAPPRPRVVVRASGFTLIELLAVLAVMGLLVVAAIGVSAPLAERYRIESAAASVASALRSARTRALTEGRDVAVSFDVSGRRFAVGSSNAQRLPPGIRFAEPAAKEAIMFTVPGTGERAALFSSRGRVVSTATPAFVYVGIPSRGLYYRVRASVVGSIGVERYVDGSWL